MPMVYDGGMTTTQITSASSAHMLANPGMFYPIPRRSTPRTAPKPVPYVALAQRINRYNANGAAVLPCTEHFGKINARQYAQGMPHPLCDERSTVLVYAKTRDGVATRAIITHEELPVATLGSRIRMNHDQTGRNLGEYFLVGAAYADGTIRGSVPAKALPIAVFK